MFEPTSKNPKMTTPKIDVFDKDNKIIDGAILILGYLMSIISIK
jgi:hypothetical protein